MISYTKLCSYPSRIVKACTGLTSSEMEDLLRTFKAQIKYHKSRWSTVTSQTRCRKMGAGKNPLLNTEDLFVMILFYFRVYPTQDLLGFIFGAHQSWACKWIHRLTPVLERTLGKRQQLPIRKYNSSKRINTFKELLEVCPDLSFIIDATERPVQRPKDSAKQKKHYSGKKKRHTIKNTIVTNKTGNKILFVGKTNPGSIHDKRMIDEEPIIFPKGSTVWMDLGYQGYSPPNAKRTFMPAKKPKDKELTEGQKQTNKKISSTRVHVEHGIGGALSTVKCDI